MKALRPSLLALSLLALPGASHGRPQADSQDAMDGPGIRPADVFNPEVKGGDEVAGKAYGGRIIVHLSTMPKHMNSVTENSAVVTWMQYLISDTLVKQDWETWEYEPRLCSSWDTEDSLVLKEGAAEKYGSAVRRIGGEEPMALIYGRVTRDGDSFVVRGTTKGNPVGEELRVDAADVEREELGTVFTFHLRDGITWHDGVPFSADDLYFTWECYQNPHVDCDETRSVYSKLVDAEVIDPLTIRFFYSEQFYGALAAVGEMPVIAKHVYDLRDPKNPDYKPDATPEEWAKNVNENPHNNEYIGTGPYRVTTWSNEYIEAERYDDYWDRDNPKYGGYLDTIRWRYINDDNAAFQAALNGELDLFMRLKSEDYFGEATESAAFKERLYKGYLYTGTYGYTAWNLKRPFFQDVQVRKALAHAFDMRDYLKTNYHGLARLVTGPPNRSSLNYDRTVPYPEYDPDLSEELLAEAGWYDRDGDGIIDKDGIPFSFEFLYPTGNEASKTFGLKYQEAVAQLGIKMTLANLEWATYLDRVLSRDFDAINMAWVPGIESDPEQIWHSKWGKEGLKSSNFISYQDPETDRLIEAIQRELDPVKRQGLWHQFHRRVASQYPYLFMLNVPRKFAMAKRFRGFKTSVIAPGYALRQVYLPAGTPGTRATPARN